MFPKIHGFAHPYMVVPVSPDILNNLLLLLWKGIPAVS